MILVVKVNYFWSVMNTRVKKKLSFVVLNVALLFNPHGSHWNAAREAKKKTLMDTKQQLTWYTKILGTEKACQFVCLSLCFVSEYVYFPAGHCTYDLIM
jgi:hypothetical protein